MGKKNSGMTCTFPGCSRPYLACGLCSSHYYQKWKLGKLTPIWYREPSPIEVVDNRAEIVLLDRHQKEKARAIIDAADAVLVSDRRWYLGTTGYVVAHPQKALKGELAPVIWLHRLILGGVGHVDHIDGNKLNNLRANLRAATRAENNQNSVRPGRELDRNIYFDKRSRKNPYLVRAQLNKVVYTAGSYASLQEARDAARKLRAELFTHCNESRHAC